MIDLLKKSVEQEIEILREISLFSKRIETASPSEKTLLAEGLEALNSRMRESSRIVIDLLGEIETGIKEKKEVQEIKKPVAYKKETTSTPLPEKIS